MGETRLLPKGELLRALAALGAAAGEAAPREIAPWLGLGLEGDSWTSDDGLFERLPAWIAEAGILSSSMPRRCLAYLRPLAGLESYFPSTLVLRLGAGRYSVQTWDCALRARAGLEVASAPPLVCSPPCSGAPLVLLIEPLPFS